jgi:hypothetical protein
MSSQMASEAVTARPGREPNKDAMAPLSARREVRARTAIPAELHKHRHGVPDGRAVTALAIDTRRN